MTESFTDSHGNRWHVTIDNGGQVSIVQRDLAALDDLLVVIVPAEDADMLARLIAAAGAAALRKQAATQSAGGA